MPGVLKLEGTNIATGDGNGAVTINNATLGSAVTFPAGHVIKTTFVVRTGGTLSLSDNTITTACSTNYTCVSSSNKLILMGLGVIGRGSADGEGAVYYYVDSTIYGEYQNRDFRDSDEMLIPSIQFDCYSGSKEILLKVQSLSNNANIDIFNGNGFAILEIQQ